jgi:hypothetical protein
MSKEMATRFTVTEDHLKLLRRAYVSWQDCEFGAPEVNPKRPYGNSSVLLDIAEILEVPCDSDDEERMPEDVQDRLHQLHRDTQAVLQIALATGEFKAGEYVRDEYDTNWRRMPEYEGESANDRIIAGLG